MEYTKGPWERNGNNILDSNGKPVFWVEPDSSGIYGEGGDIGLMVTAPDMYEALKSTLEMLETITSKDFSRGVDKPIRDMIDKVLTKAEGKKLGAVKYYGRRKLISLGL
jgi:hypothetical protein